MTTAIATDIKLVAHLMRRAAFGAPTWKLEELAARPYEQLVEDLLRVEAHERPDEDLLDRFHLEHADEESYQWFAKRWYFRMINSPRPLEEKVALLWHNRFATAASKVNNARMMGAHLELLRDHGLGSFKTLLQLLSRSPAMIWWLDQQTNHADAVNENYGRELLELFAMGRGNYTEDDVRSAARAFSGWTIDQTIPRYPNGWYDTNFVYRADDHDDGEKTFLGETGNFNGDDIVEIVARQPATARFVATNLYRFFVADVVDDAAVAELSKAYFDSNYEIRSVLRHLFNSKFFKESQGKRVRWPVELVTGTIVLTGEHRDPYEFGLDRLPTASAGMGQELLNPPTVEGWHLGREWIDSAFLIERVNFAAERFGNSGAPGIQKIIDRVRKRPSSKTPDGLLDACLYEMGPLTLANKSRTAILQQISDAGTGQTDAAFADRVCYVLQLISSAREFQLG
ncbi:MAG: DUF1800 domain-containing protein [SAR202 cluster bacterium]|nr:DUF1800 domain-containing protein [SAR202 cluster bacterium]